MRFDPKDPEGWLETLINYLVGRSWEMVSLLEWAEGFQLKKIGDTDINQYSDMSDRDATALSRNLWDSST